MFVPKNFTPEEWEVIINNFSVSTKEGKYNRVPYALWRTLAKARYDVTIWYENDSGSYKVIVNGLGPSFTKDDKSFGQYLSDSNLMNCDNKDILYPEVDINLKEFVKEYEENYQLITINSNDTVKVSTLATTATNSCDGLAAINTDAKIVVNPADFDVNALSANMISDNWSYHPSATKATAGNDGISGSVDVDLSHLPTFDTVRYMIDEAIKVDKEKKEEVKNMKGYLNFDFGPYTGDQVRMSMYGPAVKNANGTYVSYDAANDSIMDVDIFNFDASKFLFKMPCAIKDIAVGDVIVHQCCPMYVVNVPEDGKSVIVVDITAGERKAIMPTKSPFGFNFVTKVVNLLGNMMTSNPTEDNPFGNMLPFMLMENSNDFDPMMFMFMNNSCGNMNPMMLYMMAKDKDSDDFMKYFMLSNMMS